MAGRLSRPVSRSGLLRPVHVSLSPVGLAAASSSEFTATLPTRAFAVTPLTRFVSVSDIVPDPLL